MQSFELIVLVGSAAVTAGCQRQSSPDSKQPATGATRAKAIAEVQRLGGRYEIDSSDPDQPIVNVDMDGNKTDDTTVALFSGLTQLKSLGLSRTQITDKALAQLQRLERLEALSLTNCNVTDAGLKSLEALPSLQFLALGGTQITDAGLASLEKMKTLRTLYLKHTGVTQAGIQGLKKAMPQLRIVD
jgi:hypothetical protein